MDDTFSTIECQLSQENFIECYGLQRSLDYLNQQQREGCIDKRDCCGKEEYFSQNPHLSGR